MRTSEVDPLIPWLLLWSAVVVVGVVLLSAYSAYDADSKFVDHCRDSLHGTPVQQGGGLLCLSDDGRVLDVRG